MYNNSLIIYKKNKNIIKIIINKIKNFGIFKTIVLVIYAIIVVVIAYNHEICEDEAQSWLIARDLNPIQIINQMKYEGHSFLWYYILWPFAQLGFKVEIQNYISCIFAILTVYIILKKAPFNKILKLLLIFSGGMIYFYSVMARPYCMIPFLLACISTLYKNKKENQYIYAFLVGLLANTHLVMLPTSMLLVITFWGEELIIKRKSQTKENRKKLIKSLLIVLIMISIYGLIVVSTLNNCMILPNFNKTDKLTSIENVCNLIKEAYTKTVKLLYGANKVPNYYNLLVTLVVLLCIIGTKNNWKQGIIFWSQLIFTFLIHTLVWITTATRVLIVIYTLMFWLWNYMEDNQYKNKPRRNLYIEVALVVLIIMSTPNTYVLAYQDITGNFSTGKVTAEYIEDNIPENTCFIYLYNEFQQSIIAYMNKDEYKFYMPNLEKFVTYNTWNNEWNKMSTKSQIIESIEKLKMQYKDVYILNVMPTKLNIDYDIQLIYQSQDKQIKNIYSKSEKYYIYKINKK